MASNPFPSFFIIFYSFFCLGSGFDLSQLIGKDVIAVQKEMQCMQKLLPCQQFLKAPNSPPPQSCCLPLHEMVAQETDCLCTFFNNLQLFHSMNISKEDALKVPDACGAHADVSKCNTTEASSTLPPSPSTDKSSPSTSSTPSSTVPAENTTQASPTSSTKMITPYGITHLGVPAFVAMFTALVFSAY